MRLLEEQFIANGYATDFLAHSDYTWDERDDAAEHAFRDGFSNLIVQALETCPHFLSDFLSTENALSQLPPVSFFLHSFDCQTCGVWEPEGYYRTITEYMMFNNNMAGAIGMYNGGWEHQHERAQRIWTPIYLSAQPGEALDPYFFEFFLQMMERSPHYAMGISVLGAHHQVPPVNPASVEESELKHFIMTKRTMFDGTEIGLTLPEEAELSFSIYDIQGRRIACADLDMPSGRQTLTWDWKDANGHDAPCGVYFARIIANGTSLHERSLKVQVLR